MPESESERREATVHDDPHVRWAKLRVDLLIAVVVGALCYRLADHLAERRDPFDDPLMLIFPLALILLAPTLSLWRHTMAVPRWTFAVPLGGLLAVGFRDLWPLTYVVLLVLTLPSSAALWLTRHLLARKSPRTD